MKKAFWAIILIFIINTCGCVYALDSINIQSVKISDKIMRAYVKGSGDKTIVMLSGWSTSSPIDDFMPLADKLSADYKVVILEYFGYEKSDITMDERSNKVMVEEIRIALNKLAIKPPYILMPHSISGLYSLYYANNYPSEILAIIGIDMSLPQKQLERWNEETFEKDKINEHLSDLNPTIVNQWNLFFNNSKELNKIKYQPNLPVLAFLSTENVNSIDDMIKSETMQTSWININNNMITNSSIQTVKVLSGGHYLHHGQSDEIARISKEFINGL